MASFKKHMAKVRLKLMASRIAPAEINLPGDLLEVQSVLICLPPQQRELTMVKGLLPEVTKIFSKAKIYILACPGSNIYDIFPRKGYYILTPSTKHVTWLGLPNKNYLDVLGEYKFDLILDMNLDINYFMQAILLSFPNTIRVGRANFLGQPYFNLEIKTRYLRDEKNIYKSIIETLDRLMVYGQSNINNSTS